MHGTGQPDGRVEYCHNAGVAKPVLTRSQRRAKAGELPPKDRTAVQAGIGLNTRALVDYWNGEIDTLELMQRLRKV